MKGDVMRGLIRATQALLFAALMAPAQALADKSLDDALGVARKTELVFEDLAHRVSPAVVSITRFVNDEAWWNAARDGKASSGGWQQNFSGDDLRYVGKRPTGGGSGFLISNDGFIFTLRRVVVEPSTGRPADTLDVQVGNEHYGATVAGMEPTIDLAILKIIPTASRAVPEARGQRQGARRALGDRVRRPGRQREDDGAGRGVVRAVARVLPGRAERDLPANVDAGRRRRAGRAAGESPG